MFISQTLIESLLCALWMPSVGDTLTSQSEVFLSSLGLQTRVWASLTRGLRRSGTEDSEGQSGALRLDLRGWEKHLGEVMPN